MFLTENFDSIAFFIENKFKNIDLDNILYYDGCIEDILEEICFDTDAAWGVTGCSKAVFYFFEYPNYVFKIPYIGAYSFEIDDTINFKMCKSFSHNGYYCDREALIYRFASNNNLENFFAGTKYLCEVNNRPFYISEKKTHSLPQLNNNKNYLYDYDTEVLSNKYKNLGIPKKAIENLLSYYDTKDIYNLFKFLENFEVSDLHYGNLGYNEDGSICLLDYSSYMEDF